MRTTLEHTEIEHSVKGRRVSAGDAEMPDHALVSQLHESLDSSSRKFEACFGVKLRIVEVNQRKRFHA